MLGVRNDIHTIAAAGFETAAGRVDSDGHGVLGTVDESVKNLCILREYILMVGHIIFSKNALV